MKKLNMLVLGYVSIIAVLSGMANTASGEKLMNANPNREVTAFKTTAEVVVDGRLEEKAWLDAREYHLTHSLSGEKPAVDTIFKVLYDENAIYFGAICEEPSMNNLKAKCEKRDAGVWGDDCVEIFIDPSGDGRGYYHFIINALGTIYDARNTGSIERDATWNAEGIQSAGFKGETFWSIEIRLPFCNFISLRTDVSDSTWRFNIAREYKGGEPSLLTYFPLSDFSDSKSYGLLHGLDVDYARFRWQIGGLKLVSVNPTKEGYQAQLTVNVENQTGRFCAFGLRGIAILPGGKQQSFIITDMFGGDAGQVQTLPFDCQIEQGGDLKLRILLEDVRSHKIVAWNESVVPVDTSPLTLKIKHPFYRSAIYATMDVKEVILELSALYQPGFKPDDRLIISLREGSSKVISQAEVNNPQKFIGEHSLSVPALAPGD
ncbi:MAG: carbohydrate-binding family 9-like protein, partial [bacterium]|nr:carbohydrate-binding family 9-like protein [bacterium]